MKDKPWYTVAFAFCLGLACAVLLTAVGAWTGPYAEANKKAQQVRKVLDALKVPVPADISASDLVRLFDERVRRRTVDGFTVYEYTPEGADKPEAVAIEFHGPGLWGPIKGVIALESDLVTVRGIVFTEQEETPGLGAEIESEEFRRQFQGKRVVTPSGRIAIRIETPSSSAPPDAATVDGITGATLTCTKLERMLNSTLSKALTALRRQTGGTHHG